MSRPEGPCTSDDNYAMSRTLLAKRYIAHRTQQSAHAQPFWIISSRGMRRFSLLLMKIGALLHLLHG